jgi:hypothetical protein
MWPPVLLRNIAAVVWFALGAGWGYVADRELSRRYGRHVRGRFAANWALMTCYFVQTAPDFGGGHARFAR